MIDKGLRRSATQRGASTTRVAVGAIAWVMLLASCGSGDDVTAEAVSGPGDQAPADNQPKTTADGEGADVDPGSAATETTTTTTEPPAAFPIVYADNLPAGGTWGVLEFTVEEFVLDTQDPAAINTTAERPSETPNVFVQFTVENYHRARSQSLQAELFSLRLADGTEIRAADISSDLRGADTLQVERGMVSFALLDPIDSLDGAELIIGLDETPLIISVDGSVVGAADPVPFEISGSGDSLGQDIGGCTKPLTTTITGGELRLDSGLVDIAEIRESDRDAHRVVDGSVFLVVTYDVFNQGDGILCGGKANPPLIRLEIDGAAIAPSWQPAWQNDAGTTTPSESGWAVPTDATSLRLTFGIDPMWAVDLDPAVVFADLPA